MVGPKVGRASSSSALSWIAVVALASGCPGPSGGEDAGPSAADAHTLDDAPVIDAPVVDASGIDAGSGDVGTHDAGSDAAAPTDAPPPTPDAFFAPSMVRPVAPLATARVTSRRPTLRWSAPTGVTGEVQACRDRALTIDCERGSGSDGTWAPDADLAQGRWHWRIAATIDGTRHESRVWSFVVPAVSASVSSTWGGSLDFDGDGDDELVLGLPDSDAVHVYASGVSGLETSPIATRTGGRSSQFGLLVVPAGDVNGDGYADLLVTELIDGATPERVHVFHGSPTGLEATPALSLVGPGGRGASFGRAVAGAGDLDGDGYGDVIVSETGGRSTDLRGRVHAYLGGATGLASTPAASWDGTVAREGLGRWLGSGDVDGDGLGDVLVTSGDVDTAVRGRLYVIRSNTALASRTLSPLSAPADTRDAQRVTTADVNGDGYADAIASFLEGGTVDRRVYTYLGSATGPSGPSSSFLRSPVPLNSDFGVAFVGMRDLDGDGFDEVAVSAPRAPFREVPPSGGPGHVYLYRGTSSGVSDTGRERVVGPDGDDTGFGYALAGGGDLDGDGTPDLAIHAPLVGHLHVSRAFPTLEALDTETSTVRERTVLSLAY